MPRFLAVSLWCLALAVPTDARSSQDVTPPEVPGTVVGVVVDGVGAVVVGAHVTAAAADRVPAAATVTDGRGRFTFLLRPGSYTLSVRVAGFQDAAQQTTVDAGLPARPLHFVLEVAGVREAVTVTGRVGYRASESRSSTRTLTPLVNVPQSVTVVTKELMKDQLMLSMGDVLRYVPGASVHQGENNRDQVILRGNSSSADFFVDGVRDDAQHYRDLYNLDRVEVLKGPNAMTFGRGGAGGVVNRVSKAPSGDASRDLSIQGGMYDSRRVAVGINQPVGGRAAIRLDGMLEHSGSFRRAVDLRRYGLTPSMALELSPRTKLTLRHEYLNDARRADRGVTSWQGRPADVPVSTYYGNPEQSDVKSVVNLTSGTLERHAGRVTLRQHVVAAHYDRSYSNFVPGAVTANKAQVSISAYSNASTRTNVFSQTDATATGLTGAVRHTVLAGVELGRQVTDNFRRTGYFADTATSVLVPYASPAVSTPVVFRQSATDADNHLVASVVAAYAQDQMEVSRRLQFIAGIRLDAFNLRYLNNRSRETLRRPDRLVSPRAGVVVKAWDGTSLYASYGVSALPSAGDQFASLTAITEQMKPERFENYEVGIKWDLEGGLSISSAAYRLNRTNSRSSDPADPTRILQTGSQRTNGYELGINGRMTARWDVAGGYAYQDAFVTSATVAAQAGSQAPQVPHHTLSAWNSFRLHPRLSAGLGVLARTDMFAAIDNTVRLPGYLRADAAGYLTLRRGVRLQANVENLFDTTYYSNADGNTNISPGSPRTVRVALTATF